MVRVNSALESGDGPVFVSHNSLGGEYETLVAQSPDYGGEDVTVVIELHKVPPGFVGTLYSVASQLIAVELQY